MINHKEFIPLIQDIQNREEHTKYCGYYTSYPAVCTCDKQDRINDKIAIMIWKAIDYALDAYETWASTVEICELCGPHTTPLDDAFAAALKAAKESINEQAKET